MKRFFAKKAITAIFFIGIVFAFGFLNAKTAYTSIKTEIEKYSVQKDKWQGLSGLVTGLNTAVTDNVFSKYTFIEGYGYVQEVLNKKEVNNFEVVKAKDGTLHYTYFTSGPNPVDTLVERMERLQTAAEKTGAKVMYVMTPDKYIRGQTEFETGMPYNYANETADNFLNSLNDSGIDTLDFRKLMQQYGKYTPESFYKTDHHWKVETAFWAFTAFTDHLKYRYGFEFPHADIYTQIDNYNQIVYPNSYIGSMGRKEGKLYSEVEDFTLIYPKFDTNYYFYAQNGPQDIQTQGRFEKSLLFTDVLAGDKDIYDAQNDKYFIYMNGNPGFVEINNYDEPDGAKVLFIKDSLMVPVASFFSLGCAKVYMIDPRYYAGSIEDVIEKFNFDYVFVSYTPQNITEEFFPFYKEEAN